MYYLQVLFDYNWSFVNSILNYKKIDYDLWHFRLGHLSNKVFKILCICFPYICTNSKHICHVCNFSKQHNLPFQLSNSSTTNDFNLIHVDIWGLFFSLMFVAIGFFSRLLTSILDIHEFILWNLRVRLEHYFQNLSHMLRINFIMLSKLLGLIMRKSLSIMSCMIYLVFYTKGLVWRLHNRILLWRENTNIYWMLLAVWCLILDCLNLTGVFSHVVHIINRLPSISLNEKSPYPLIANGFIK